MQEKKARLSSNCNPDFVSYFQTITSLETFLGQEDLSMSQQLDLIGGWKAPKNWDIAGNDRTPGRRKWFPLQGPAAALFQKAEGHPGISDLLMERV